MMHSKVLKRDASCRTLVNPIFSSFRLLEDIGSQNEGIWKIYDATRKLDDAAASVFVCDKKNLERVCKTRKRTEMAVEVLRREVSNLNNYRHPCILRLFHPIEETSTSIAYATEPVIGTLASIFHLLRLAEKSSGSLNRRDAEHDDRAMSSAGQIQTEVFSVLEAKYGVLQINEALKYMHSAQHVCHGNVSLDNVFLTRNGLWKLGGLAFVDKIFGDKRSSLLSPFSSKWPTVAQPNLDYSPPELQLDCKTQLDASSDIFSLGLLICSIFMGGRSLINANNDIANYVAAADNLHMRFERDAAPYLPPGLVDPVRRMLHRNPHQRPTTELFSLHKFFHDDSLLLLQTMSTFKSKDNLEKVEALAKLADQAEKLPKKLLYPQIMPILLASMPIADLQEQALKAYLAVVKCSTQIEFRAALSQSTSQVVQSLVTNEAVMVLLQKVDVLTAKLNDEEILQILLPAVFKALDSQSPQLAQNSLKSIITILQELDEAESASRDHVLPKMYNILQSMDSSSALKVEVVNCVGRLMTLLCDQITTEEILPFLLRLDMTDSEVYFAIVSLFGRLFSEKSILLSPNYLATLVLPRLIPQVASPKLRIDQFSQTIKVFHCMLEVIESHRVFRKTSTTGRSSSTDRSMSGRTPTILMQQTAIDHSMPVSGGLLIPVPQHNCFSNFSNEVAHFSASQSTEQSQPDTSVKGDYQILQILHKENDSSLDQPTPTSLARRHSFQSVRPESAAEQPEISCGSQRSSLSGGFAALKDAFKDKLSFGSLQMTSLSPLNAASSYYRQLSRSFNWLTNQEQEKECSELDRCANTRTSHSNSLNATTVSSVNITNVCNKLFRPTASLGTTACVTLPASPKTRWQGFRESVHHTFDS